MAFNDERGLEFSKVVVEGKIRNQEKLLRYFGKYIKSVDNGRFVDKVVIAHVNLGETLTMKDGLLEAETRNVIGNKIIERLETQETFEGKKYKIRSIIQMQARNLSSSSGYLRLLC